MKESKENRRRRQCQSSLTIGTLRLMTYTGLFLFFWLTMSVNNWQLYHINRTVAIVLFAWFSMTAAMHGTYGGYDVGRKKSRPIISNMALGTLFTDTAAYLVLQIMNVNNYNKATLELLGADFSWLALCYALQLVWLVVMVKMGNEIYFRINPPRDCLLILGDLNNQSMVEEKVRRYRLQWRIVDVALWDEPNLLARIENVQVVFMANVPDEVRLTLLKVCYDLHRDVLCKAQLQDIMMSNARQVVVDDAPFLEMDYHKTTFGQRFIKRAMDVTASALVLTVLSPLYLLIALWIKLDDGGPVLFSQKRVTGDGSEFTIHKFRTMSLDASEEAHPSSATANDARITRAGRVLRRSRLDELPQFANILVGDMSLVGPRPEMLENLDRYKIALPTFVYREKMKAGLTGYAQIEGRYNTSAEDKLMLDLMYIESFSIREDIKLIFRTFTVLFKKDSTQGFENVEAKRAGDAAAREKTVELASKNSVRRLPVKQKVKPRRISQNKSA